MEFYLNGNHWNIADYTKKSFAGSYENNDYFDHYQYKTPKKFFEAMLEAAKEDGRREIRSKMLSALGLN